MEKVKLRIAELRHRKNVTQQQLAEYVGVSFQTILFNRDGEDYDGRVVNAFVELGKILENM